MIHPEMNPDVKRHNDGDDEGWERHEGFFRRKYTSYEQYLQKQAAKLDDRPGWCRERSEQLRQQLSGRLDQIEVVEPGMAVLCLGARLGGEVQAFLEHGAFAVGIDLNPGIGNQYVVHGDFHELQFTDRSIDLVYLNCLDHSLEPEKLFGEIGRVLKPGAIFLLESKAGSNEQERKPAGSDHWDCLEFENWDRLMEIIEGYGFRVEEAYTNKVKGLPYGAIFRSRK